MYYWYNIVKWATVQSFNSCNKLLVILNLKKVNTLSILVKYNDVFKLLKFVFI